MDIGTILSGWTLLCLIVFVAICVWAWSGKRKSTFEDAARIPFNEDSTTSGSEDNDNG